MISDHIQDLITAYKSKPNSEFKNRVISHLKDAYALARVDEIDQDSYKGFKDPIQAVGAEFMKMGTSMVGCVCPAGARLRSCPVHGSQV